MDRLDGNALAGVLVEALGDDPTGSTTTCTSCGAEPVVAQLLVTRREGRDEACCPACGALLLVVTHAATPVAHLVGGGDLAPEG